VGGWLQSRTAESVIAASDVPVQYFPSVITIELAVAGALLWQMRYFEPEDRRRARARLPDARLRLGLALVLGTTLFGSLWAMADEGPKWAALVVTVGLAISVIPILVRGLPPLTTAIAVLFGGVIAPVLLAAWLRAERQYR
jgi:hypothetical protein